MLGFLPIIGPIIEGILGPIFNFFNKKEDTKIAQINADVVKTQTAASVTIAYKDDKALSIMRDLAIFPVVAWMGIVGWDNIVRPTWPHLYLEVLAYPAGPLEYLPYAVLTFLFGTIAVKKLT